MKTLKITLRQAILCVSILFCFSFFASPAMAQSSPPVVEWYLNSPTTKQSYTNNSADWIYSIVQTQDGNYIAVGYTEISSGTTIPVVMEINSGGSIVWERKYAPSIFYNLSSVYTSGPQPYHQGWVASTFDDVHEIYDNTLPGGAGYAYIISGEYADGYSNSAHGFTPLGSYSAGNNNFFYAVEITENGDSVLDNSNNCFGSSYGSSYGIREFWAYMLTDPSLSYGSGSAWATYSRQAVDPIVESKSYNS